MTSRYTYDRRYSAHYAGRIITIPDQVAAAQREWDLSGRSFPAIESSHRWRGRKIRVRLDGEAYGLHTPGTGDCVCRSI